MNLVPHEKIDRAILLIRGKKVMLDSDLASLYGVTTKRLKEQVKRNISRFPNDFMFILTKEEKSEVVANCDHLSKLKFSAANPFAFTEHGAIMLASVLHSEIAIRVSIEVVRAFVRIREITLKHKQLASEIKRIEEKFDKKILVLYRILENWSPPSRPEDMPQIGFKQQ